MKALLNILAGLLLLVQSYKVKKEQEDAQKQADVINEKPADWFNDHFNSSLHQRTDSEDRPAEASTSKTSDNR